MDGATTPGLRRARRRRRLFFLSGALCFPLARMDQTVAVPTGEDRTAVENRHALPASARRAAKPRPPTAEVAGRPFQMGCAFHRLPFPAAVPAATAEHHVVDFRADPDRCDLLAVACSLPAEGPARIQQAIALQPPDVRRPHFAGGVLAVLVSPPASAAAHVLALRSCRNHLASLQSAFAFLPDRLVGSQRQANDASEPGDGLGAPAAACSFRRAGAEPASMAERADDLREGLRDLLGRGGEAELPIDLGQ